MLRHCEHIDKTESAQADHIAGNQATSGSESSLSARISKLELSTMDDKEHGQGARIVDNGKHKMLIPERIWRNAGQLSSA